jgi:hypothetical protein
MWFSASLTAFAGVNDSFLEAAILIVAPVAGLRPSRAARLVTLNLPKPLSEISSPLAAALNEAGDVVAAQRTYRSVLDNFPGDSVAKFMLKECEESRSPRRLAAS